MGASEAVHFDEAVLGMERVTNIKHRDAVVVIHHCEGFGGFSISVDRNESVDTYAL